MPKQHTIHVPERRLAMADGEFVLFRADHRGIYALEQHTGQGLMGFLEALQSGGAPPMSRIYDLAWGLSATHRMRTGSAETFEEFMDRIPPLSTMMQGFAMPLIAVVMEAFRGEAEADSGNADAPAAAPPAEPEAAPGQ